MDDRDRPWPFVGDLPTESSELLRHKLRAVQVGVGETEDEELVWVRDHDLVVVGNLDEKVLVVGDPEGVNGLPALL